jgi:hypothetical protein
MELVFALGIGALAAMVTAGAFRDIAERSTLITAKRNLLLAVLETRRLAYTTNDSARLLVAPGASAVTVAGVSSEYRHELGGGVIVSDAPLRRHIKFRPDGMADNATVTLSRTDRPESIDIVVNQRGMFR